MNRSRLNAFTDDLTRQQLYELLLYVGSYFGPRFFGTVKAWRKQNKLPFDRCD